MANTTKILHSPLAPKQTARRTALTGIAALEAGQPRAVCDFILNGDKSKIAAIEASIVELRADL